MEDIMEMMKKKIEAQLSGLQYKESEKHEEIYRVHHEETSAWSKLVRR